MNQAGDPEPLAYGFSDTGPQNTFWQLALLPDGIYSWQYQDASPTRPAPVDVRTWVLSTDTLTLQDAAAPGSSWTPTSNSASAAAEQPASDPLGLGDQGRAVATVARSALREYAASASVAATTIAAPHHCRPSNRSPARYPAATPNTGISGRKPPATVAAAGAARPGRTRTRGRSRDDARQRREPP